MSSNNAVEREGWSGRFGAIMSMAGLHAVGLDIAGEVKE